LPLYDNTGVVLEKKIKKIVSYMFEKKADCWIKNASDSTGVFS